jgi:UDP-N-acetylglucosamine 2-epimerase
MERADAEFGWALHEFGASVLEALWLPCFQALMASARTHAAPRLRPSALRMVAHHARRRVWLWAAEAAPAKPAFVFWPVTRTHLPGALPVAAALERRGASLVFFTDKPALARALGDSGREIHVPRGTARVRARARARARAARRLVRGIPAITTLGNDAEKALRTAVWTHLPLAFESIATARYLLTELEPRALVVGNDISVEGRAACLVAARQNVPTVCAAHGASSANPLHGDHVAERVLVYGETDRRELASFGLPRDRAVVCGAPSFDAYPGQSGRAYPAVERALELTPGRRWILIATSGPGDKVSSAHHRALIEVFAELAERFPDVRIAVKLHPKDTLENYSSAARSGLRVFGATTPLGQLPIADWLQGCPLLVTGGSAVALEAMLLDVPVLTVDLMNELESVDFIVAGATHHAASKEVLFDAVARFAAGGDLPPRAEQFLAEKFHARDGRAAERAADAILALVASRP